MSVYEDNWYDVTIECRYCHDLYDTHMQLFAEREVTLVKELLEKIFNHCHICYSVKEQFAITVSNQYYTHEEIIQLKNETKKPPGADT